VTLHNFLLFISACIALALIPGPDMAYMLARCIAQGRRAGVLAALGFNLGGLVHATAAALGLSAVLASSSTAFTAVKWFGAAYLIYLGIAAIRSRPGQMSIAEGVAAGPRGKTILWQAFLSDVLNPKVALFFVAFVPQFVDPHAPHPGLQFFLLGITCNLVCLPINLLLVLFSSRFTQTLRGNAAVSRWLQRGMGTLFIALGLRLAVEKT
jgi:threonine/homoserine/homoserine lactone efflux protein